MQSFVFVFVDLSETELLMELSMNFCDFLKERICFQLKKSRLEFADDLSRDSEGKIHCNFL